MKHFFKLLLIAILFVSKTSNAQNEPNVFIGNWLAIDFWNNESPLILSEDNYISITINGDFIDGKNFIVKGGKNNGKKGELKYSIDADKNPIEIDLIALMDNDEKGRILGAIKLINENNFVMILSFDGTRNTNFDDTDEQNIIKVRRMVDDN
ncbi:hypothetical protein [Paenimyroides aestuarii]|uniref:Uncharacterized protein n=1 Tax=Paenimyroides aestuarii TaxID=2968490 RepID=A0ABY5NU52_9FLAO|nr:hypothetical protein [Paenimyroides aestuarii]UUV22115.1 hypothetical protein NPX36_03460 [Paenimyroides aestuarii]